MIEFEWIKMSNFMSVGNMPVEIQFDRNAVTMISGPNGSCKSGIVSDSLTFVLYGTAYRNVKKSQLINSINQRGTVVEVQFKTRGKTYRVIRGIKPDVFEIYENDMLINQEAAVRDYQQILELNILGMNLKSFKQIVILSVADYVPFMELKSRERRAIVEELLDIQIFSVMNEVLSENRSELRELKGKIQTKINSLEIDLRSHASKIESLKAKDQSIIESNNVKINEAQEMVQQRLVQIDTLNEKLQTLTTELPNIQELNTKKTKIQGILSKTNSAKERLGKDIIFFQTHDDCPVCSQKITDELKTSMIESKSGKMVEVNVVETQASSQMEELKLILKSAVDLNNQIREINSEISSLNASITSNQRYIQQLESHNTDIQNKGVDEEERERNAYDAMFKQRETFESKLETVTIKEDDYQVCAKLLKDDGIKTQIIDKYIPTINRILNHYLENFEFAVSFNFDNNFNEVIRSRYRDEFSYASFSKGERARIDFAITLAFREIAKIKNSVSANVLMIDELFENMDYFGVNKALEMLGSLKGTHSFIVSHEQEIIDSSQHRIQLAKDQGFTSK
jgi:DNA repair exonuclease SbcCD ATPase subunit